MKLFVFYHFHLHFLFFLCIPLKKCSIFVNRLKKRRIESTFGITMLRTVRDLFLL